jgi:uncharacterized protein
MTLETAKEAVHFILNNYKKKKELFPNDPKVKCSITFFGGEPTLMWDQIIKPLTLYIRENDFPISLSMTSNGSLLDKEKIDFMKKNKIGLLLSMDGDRITQEYNRPCLNSSLSSFDLTSKNIPLILKTYQEITYRATIFAPTAHHTFDNYIYALNQGFKNIYLLPDSRNFWTEEQKNFLYEELNKIYAFMDFCFSKNLMPPIRFKLIERSFERILRHDIRVINNSIDPEAEKSHSIIRCGLGTTLGSIGYDGKIYGCQEQTSKGVNSKFYIGDIYQGGIDKNKHYKLLDHYFEKKENTCENIKLCSDCLLKYECGDLACPSSGYDLFNEFHKDSEIHCLWSRWMVQNSIIMMNKYVKEDNKIFKQYLYQYCNYNKYFNEEVN